MKTVKWGVTENVSVRIMPSVQSCMWLVTMYTLPMKATLEALVSHAAVHCVIGQLEMCPTTGRHHLQFVIHVNRMTMVALKSVIGDATVHVEPVAHGWSAAVTYCTKEETRIDGPWTLNKEGMHVSDLGVLVKSGRSAAATGAKAAKRAKLTDMVVDACKRGVGARAVMEELPQAYLLYGAKVKELAEMYAPGRTYMQAKKVFHLWGPPRTGKTRRAMWELEHVEGGYDDVVMTPGGFVVGYTGKKGVLIDEPRREVLDVTLCLRLFDHYTCKANVKGSEVMWKPEVIYVTSNLSLDELFNTTRSEQLEALHRRVTEIHMTKEWTPPDVEELVARREAMEIVSDDEEPIVSGAIPDAQPLLGGLMHVPDLDATQEIQPDDDDLWLRRD